MACSVAIYRYCGIESRDCSLNAGFGVAAVAMRRDSAVGGVRTAVLSDRHCHSRVGSGYKQNKCAAAYPTGYRDSECDRTGRLEARLCERSPFDSTAVGFDSAVPAPVAADHVVYHPAIGARRRAVYGVVSTARSIRAPRFGRTGPGSTISQGAARAGTMAYTRTRRLFCTVGKRIHKANVAPQKWEGRLHTEVPLPNAFTAPTYEHMNAPTSARAAHALSGAK